MFFLKLNSLKYKLNDIKCDVNLKIRDIETKNLRESQKNHNKTMELYMGTGFPVNVPKKILEPELEGKKSGYSKAAKQFEPIFIEIEQQYISTKEKIEIELSQLDMKSDKLISILEQLECEKSKLESELHNKMNSVGSALGMSAGNIGAIGIVGILSTVYRKFEKAEQEGFLEAKNMYNEKIHTLKVELKKLEIKGNSEINELIKLITQVNSEIAENKMKITELKILS